MTIKVNCMKIKLNIFLRLSAPSENFQKAPWLGPAHQNILFDCSGLSNSLMKFLSGASMKNSPLMTRPNFLLAELGWVCCCLRGLGWSNMAVAAAKRLMHKHLWQAFWAKNLKNILQWQTCLRIWTFTSKAPFSDIMHSVHISKYLLVRL